MTNDDDLTEVTTKLQNLTNEFRAFDGLIEAAKDNTKMDATNTYTESRKLLVKKLTDHIRDGFALAPDKTLWVYKDGAYEPGDQELNRRVIEALGNDFTAAHLTTVKAYIKCLPPETLPRLDYSTPKPEYIILQNGTHHWPSNQLIDHDSGVRSTVKLPITYDPNATCPKFDQFLNEVAAEDSTDYLWEALGYLLMAGNPLGTAFLIQGPSPSGKSTFIKVLQKLVGRQNAVNLPLDQVCRDRFAYAGLAGKLANIGSDISPNLPINPTNLAAMRGEHLFRAQHKYGEVFCFTNWAVSVFTVKDTWRPSYGLSQDLDRWQMISFPNAVQSPLRLNYADELAEEASGIYNKAIDGLRRVINRGKFNRPPSSRALATRFDTTTNLVFSWLDSDQRVTVNNSRDRSVWTPRAALHRAFDAWSHEHKAPTIARKGFYITLRGLGYEDIRKPNGDCFYGIQLNSECKDK